MASPSPGKRQADDVQRDDSPPPKPTMPMKKARQSKKQGEAMEIDALELEWRPKRAPRSRQPLLCCGMCDENDRDNQVRYSVLGPAAEDGGSGDSIAVCESCHEWIVRRMPGCSVLEVLREKKADENIGKTMDKAIESHPVTEEERNTTSLSESTGDNLAVKQFDGSGWFVKDTYDLLSYAKYVSECKKTPKQGNSPMVRVQNIFGEWKIRYAATLESTPNQRLEVYSQRHHEVGVMPAVGMAKVVFNGQREMCLRAHARAAFSESGIKNLHNKIPTLAQMKGEDASAQRSGGQKERVGTPSDVLGGSSSPGKTDRRVLNVTEDHPPEETVTDANLEDEAEPWDVEEERTNACDDIDADEPDPEELQQFSFYVYETITLPRIAAHEVTAPEHTIQHWIDRSPAVMAIHGMELKEARNFLKRLLDKSSTPSEDKKRGNAHLMLLDHGYGVSNKKLPEKTPEKKNEHCEQLHAAGIAWPEDTQFQLVGFDCRPSWSTFRKSDDSDVGGMNDSLSELKKRLQQWKYNGVGHMGAFNPTDANLGDTSCPEKAQAQFFLSEVFRDHLFKWIDDGDSKSLRTVYNFASLSLEMGAWELPENIEEVVISPWAATALDITQRCLKILRAVGDPKPMSDTAVDVFQDIEMVYNRAQDSNDVSIWASLGRSLLAGTSSKVPFSRVKKIASSCIHHLPGFRQALETMRQVSTDPSCGTTAVFEESGPLIPYYAKMLDAETAKSLEEALLQALGATVDFTIEKIQGVDHTDMGQHKQAQSTVQEWTSCVSKLSGHCPSSDSLLKVKLQLDSVMSSIKSLKAKEEGESTLKKYRDGECDVKTVLAGLSHMKGQKMPATEIDKLQQELLKTWVFIQPGDAEAVSRIVSNPDMRELLTSVSGMLTTSEAAAAKDFAKLFQDAGSLSVHLSKEHDVLSQMEHGKVSEELTLTMGNVDRSYSAISKKKKVADGLKGSEETLELLKTWAKEAVQPHVQVETKFLESQLSSLGSFADAVSVYLEKPGTNTWLQEMSKQADHLALGKLAEDSLPYKECPDILAKIDDLKQACVAYSNYTKKFNMAVKPEDTSQFERAKKLVPDSLKLYFSLMVAHTTYTTLKMTRSKARDEMDRVTKSMTKRDFVPGAELPQNVVDLYRKVLRQKPL